MKNFNETSKDMKNSQRNTKHSSKYECVTGILNLVDQKLLPNNFNNRTIEEQYAWIKENIAELFPNVPQSLLKYIPSSYYQIDLPSMEKPKWLDVNKYRKGQKFVREHYFSIVLTTITGLMHLYTFDDFLKPLIMTRQSDTLYSGFKRYLSTLLRFFNWYEGEPWIEETPAYTDMLYVRKMHTTMRNKLYKLDNKQIDNASKIAEPWCQDRELLMKDFAAACPFESIGQRPYSLLAKMSCKPKGINNTDFAISQCCFVSSLVLWPESVGAHDATDDDLEAVCHMWRCYGYYLGIEDEYNFCRGSLEEIKGRMRDLYQYWIIPNFKELTPEWEHMTRCVVVPIEYYPLIYLPYKVVILLSTELFNIDMSHLYKSLSYSEWIAYKFWKFLISYASKFSLLRALINKIVFKIIHKAANYSPEQNAELQRKSKEQLSNLSAIKSNLKYCSNYEVSSILT